MDETLLRAVARVLQRKSEAEIRHALTTVKPGGRDASVYLAALHRIETDRSHQQEARVEERHRESIFEDRFARKIAFAAFLLSAFSLGMTLYDRFFPSVVQHSPHSSQVSPTEATSEGQRSSTLTPSSSPSEE